MTKLSLHTFVHLTGSFFRLKAKLLANKNFFGLNNRFLRESGMASTLKMEYQFFFCIFQKNSAMATLGLKEIGKFLFEGREKDLPFFLTFPKKFSRFLQTIAEFFWKMQKKTHCIPF